LFQYHWTANLAESFEIGVHFCQIISRRWHFVRLSKDQFANCQLTSLTAFLLLRKLVIQEVVLLRVVPEDAER
jgi:hypothetical protein